MQLDHLSLANFRNFARLELDLPPNVTLLIGENAQGKSNLLEAINYLATTRSYRATGDRELINWLAANDPLPHARLVARVVKQEGDTLLEMTLMGQPEKTGEPAADDESVNGRFSLFQPAAASLQKRLRVNGVARRAIDVIGQVNVVMFGPQDVDLIGGAPALRRRYLDATFCQTNRAYAHALQGYNRVVMQRNHLLRRIAEALAGEDELAFWDAKLIEHGAHILDTRRAGVDMLNVMAHDVHGQLTDGSERLRIIYRSTLHGESDDTAANFRSALHRGRRRDIQAGLTLTGPHRDDLSFLVDGVDMRVYGSRGQQRTIALSLKFAEARYMCGVVGEEPILLMDDIMSELDEKRRRWVLQAIAGGGQVMLTATDTVDFAADFLARVTLLQVRSGVVEPVLSAYDG